MNIIQLEYFRTVMEFGSVTDAAHKLCVTQPAVSKQIHLLEDEFECKLFLRENNHLKPTPAARFLSGKLQTVLPEFRNLSSEMNEFMKRVAGKLRIGCGPFASAHVLPDLIVELQERYPGIKPEISEKDSFFRDLEEGTLDIMIGVNKPKTSNFRYTTMFSGPLTIIASKESPLAKGNKITKSSLSVQPYISLSYEPIRGTILRKMPYLNQNLFQVESRYPQTLIAYVERNLGFTILPEYLLHDLPAGVVKLPYRTGLTNENGYMFRAKRSLTQPMKALLQLLEEKYPKHERM